MSTLAISFSGRQDGNCDVIARYVVGTDGKMIRFRDLEIHICSRCDYECFSGVCKYREDDVYGLYDEMCRYDKIVLVVPIYCGNPSALYFAFHERGQDYFFHNEGNYEKILRRLYIIGVYGDRNADPDFVPCLEKWFLGSRYQNRVLGLERHRHGQKMEDCILNADGVAEQVLRFLEER